MTSESFLCPSVLIVFCILYLQLMRCKCLISCIPFKSEASLQVTEPRTVAHSLRFSLMDTVTYYASYEFVKAQERYYATVIKTAWILLFSLKDSNDSGITSVFQLLRKSLSTWICQFVFNFKILGKCLLLHYFNSFLILLRDRTLPPLQTHYFSTVFFTTFQYLMLGLEDQNSLWRISPFVSSQCEAICTFQRH